MMNCGMACTVIKYLNAMDISVQFEDGTIVEHKSVDAFQNGAIANPTLGNKYTRKLNTSILGESKRMNCGMICTVIEDNGSMDITVKFEDETIVNHRTRNCFFKGSISNPNYADKKSLPQAVVFYFIKKYFSDTQINYRPDWLKNPKTGRNLEIDIWIPSLKVGIEYDGVWRHSKETKLSKLKATLICQSDEIKFLITILERDTVVHTSDKHINYQLHYISSGSPTSSEYKSLFVELQEVIEQILRSLEIEAEVIITDELIQHAYDDYLESIYKSKIN